MLAIEDGWNAGSLAITPVIAMTRSLAVEWGRHGIRNNAIAPGPFPTKGAWDRLLPGEMAAKFDFKNRVPLKRVGDHQELANLANWLDDLDRQLETHLTTVGIVGREDLNDEAAAEIDRLRPKNWFYFMDAES